VPVEMFAFSDAAMDEYKNLSVIGLFVYVLYSNYWTRLLALVSFLTYFGICIYHKKEVLPSLDFTSIKSSLLNEPLVFEDTTPITRSRKKRRGSE